jgi:hypothetical protein
VGDPQRAASEAPELEAQAGRGIGGDDPVVALALMALQQGDVAAATDRLARARSDDDPNVLAVRALVRAAAGEPGAGDDADRIEDLAGATYFDLALGHVGAALEASVADTGSAEAQRRLSLARSAVAPTEDAVAKVIVETAAVAVATRLNLAEAEEVAAWTEHLRAKIGIEARGWERAFALAVRAPAG